MQSRVLMLLLKHRNAITYHVNPSFEDLAIDRRESLAGLHEYLCSLDVDSQGPVKFDDRVEHEAQQQDDNSSGHSNNNIAHRARLPSVRPAWPSIPYFNPCSVMNLSRSLSRNLFNSG